MFLCCIFAMNTIVAYGATEKTCSETKLYLESGQNIDDDEFLYRNDIEHEKAKNGVLNSTARSGGDAMVYECDRSNRDKNCSNRGVVTLEPGHWYMGNRIDHKETYTCWTNNLLHWNDKWVPGASVCRIQNTEVAIGSSYEKSLTLEQCSGLWITDNINGILFKAVCEEGPVAKCIAVECIDGMEPNTEGICRPIVKKNCPGGAAVGSREIKPCSADKANGNQCKRLCGENGVWSDWSIESCKDGYGVILEGKETKCVKKSQPNPAPTPEPNPVPTPQAVVWNCPVLNFASYVSCPDADKAIADLKVYCASNESRSQAGYDAMVNLVNVYIEDCQAKQKENDALNQRNKLNSLNASILGAMDGWKKTLSVWKTNKGDFNTARLASDSVAGVVLGTAGGLITSKVVKKNQVKTGFEDISCTIGGQKVADWSDEFTVGIQ